MPINASELSPEILARIKFMMDEQGLQSTVEGTKKVEEGMGKVEAATKKADEAAKRMQVSYREFRQLGMAFGRIGSELTIMGAALMGPILLAANKYVTIAGQSEAISRKWLEATQSIDESINRIGRVAAQTVLPGLERIAMLAQNFAGFVEKYPQVITAVGEAGGLLVAAGMLFNAAALISRNIYAFGKILDFMQKSGIIGQIAAGGGAATAGAGGLGLLGTVGTVVGAAAGASLPILIASAVGNALGIKPGQYSPAWFSQQLMPGQVFGQSTQTKEDNFLSDLGKLLGSAFGPTQFIPAITAAAANPTNTKQMQLYQNYEAANLKAEEAFQSKRADMIQKYSEQAQQAEEQFTSNRIRELQDYARNEAQTESDYYANRMKLARNHGQEMERMEADHQKTMRRLAEDHAQRVRELADSQDALGLLHEIQNYNVERDRQEQDYSDQVAQKNAQFAQELADNEQQYIIERKRREEELVLKMRREDEDFCNQQDQRRRQYNQQLYDLETAFANEQIVRANAFNQQIKDTFDALTQERILRQAFTQAMLNDLNAAIVAAGGQPIAIAARDLNTGTGAGGVVWNDRRQFSSSLSAQDRMLINQDTRNILAGAFAP